MRQRPLISLLAVATFAAAGTMALPAHSAEAVWTVAPTPVPVGPTESLLRSVSCVSAQACMAVGFTDYGHPAVNGEAVAIGSLSRDLEWLFLAPGSHPRLAGANPELYTVACASAAFCVAVGRSGHPRTQPSSTTTRNQARGRSWRRGTEQHGRCSRILCRSSGEHAWRRLVPLELILHRGKGQPCTGTRTCTRGGVEWDGLEAADPAAYRGSRRPLAGRLVRPGFVPGRGFLPLHDRKIPFSSRSAGTGVAGAWTLRAATSRLNQMASRACRAPSALRWGGGPSAGPTVAPPFAERWNGSRWTLVTSGLPKHGPLYGVSCVTSAFV